MKKRLVKKSWCFAIILLFVGASIVPSAIGNNYSSTNLISATDMQTNANIEFLEVWVGDASVEYGWRLFRDTSANVTCAPDDEITLNLSQPTTLYPIFLFNTSLNLKKDFISRRLGSYLLEITIYINGDKITAYDRGTMSGTMTGYYPDVLACGIKGISITDNVTLEIEITASAWAFVFPFWSIPSWADWCKRNVTVHVQLP